MTNRERLYTAIKAHPKFKDVRGELDFLINDVEREEDGYDLVDAFLDFFDTSETRGESGPVRFCRQVLIKAGFYRVFPESQLKKTVCLGGRAWSFSMAGLKYSPVTGLDHWVRNDVQESVSEGLKK